jgi:hypothetical protein
MLVYLSILSGSDLKSLTILSMNPLSYIFLIISEVCNGITPAILTALAPIPTNITQVVLSKLKHEIATH